MMSKENPGDVQRAISSAVAKEVSDTDILARLAGKVGVVSPDDITEATARFRALRGRAVKELPRMRWGAAMTLDDIKVARFAFEIAQEQPGVDEIAVRALLRETWGYLYGR